MEGVVNVEWHGQDYLHLKRHIVCSGLATPGLGATLGDGQKIKNYFSSFRDFSGKS